MANETDDKTIRFQLEPSTHGVPDDELLTDICRVASKLQKSSVTCNDYQQFGRYDRTTISRRFGSWNEALLKAGLRIVHSNDIPIKKLFKNLELVWIRLGRQPSLREMVRPVSLYSGDTYKRRFGTWRKALEAFVLFVKSTAELEVVIEQSKVNLPKKRTNRDPSFRLRFLVMRRDNFRCRNCGKSPATHLNVELQIDHIVAWSQGGETVLDNLQTLCSLCNLGKGSLNATDGG